MKRRKLIEVSGNVENSTFAAMEICEESNDEDEDLFKSNSFALLRVFHFVANKLNDQFNRIAALADPVFFDSSHRYLKLQVFRI